MKLHEKIFKFTFIYINSLKLPSMYEGEVAEWSKALIAFKHHDFGVSSNLLRDCKFFLFLRIKLLNYYTIFHEYFISRPSIYN